MRTLADERERAELLRRLNALRPDTAPHWGRFDAAAMLAHVGDSIAVALGEMPSGRMGPKIFRSFPLKQLIIYVLPFPRGASSPKEFLVTAPENFAAAKKRLETLMERAAAALPGPGPEHPLLGALTIDAWRVLGWKHLDHHLRQFGC